jgi:hypothetical protein
MRYRIGTNPDDLTPVLVDHLTLGTAVLGLIIGIVFVVAGRRARQYWLAIWGGTLVVASVIYLGAVVFGYV